jgi:hypothetical protein
MTTLFLNSDPDTMATAQASTKVTAVMLKLYCRMNRNNIIDKKQLQKHMDWIKDYRTWKKYWKELQDLNVIMALDKKTWMVSPYQCYHDGVSQKMLINQWEAIRRN